MTPAESADSTSTTTDETEFDAIIPVVKELHQHFILVHQVLCGLLERLFLRLDQLELGHYLQHLVWLFFSFLLIVL